ncbi:hypothetical protein EPA93_22165 [Ktedonosporobacter rubrisoli]|uniref:Uncharacterized protein n=1 Tax=Ktedonosporobacter rubrisoli TaxID=2509675 RepID=A0A4V0YZ56_KTERU|nr:hypothetical protein [Ktedonosporobacter rubrisoli]QBD78551.1 hypothetical protein EPA93_22165 [Ktedonosporobacter rubrisoli]
MKRVIPIGLVALVAALLATFFTVLPASAHEVRNVGKYTFVVGFLNEPAYANLQNSIDLTICQGKECTYTVKDGSRVVANPVNDADKTLKAEVSIGASAPLNLPLAPRWANPGKYASYFIPTKTGAYTFHISGTLNGDKIDEKFTSGPNTFGEVEAITSYPSATASGQNQSGADTAALQSQIKEARDSASSATTFGIIGIVVGALGLLAAGFALTRKPQAQAASEKAAQKDTADSLRG